MQDVDDAAAPRRSGRLTALLVAAALLVGGAAGVALASTHPWRRSSTSVLLPVGRPPHAYPAALVAAYRASGAADAGCSLMLGRAAGTPRFRVLRDTFELTYPSGLTVVLGDESGVHVPDPDVLGPSVAATADHLLVYRARGTGYLVGDDGCAVSAAVWGRVGRAQHALLDAPVVVDYLAGLRPVPGTAVPPPPPVPTLADHLVSALGLGGPADCGEAELNVAGARATPGCEGVYWDDVYAVDGSHVTAWVSRYATAADATYQYGIEKRYMRQYAGKKADTTLRGISPSQFILTNNGQLCEASFLSGRFVVQVEAAALTSARVAPLACAKAQQVAAAVRPVVLRWQAEEPAGPLF